MHDETAACAAVEAFVESSSYEGVEDERTQVVDLIACLLHLFPDEAEEISAEAFRHFSEDEPAPDPDDEPICWDGPDLREIVAEAREVRFGRFRLNRLARFRRKHTSPAVEQPRRAVMAEIPEATALDFVETFAVGDCAPEVVSALQCSEVDAMAEMLAALGASEAAEHWRAEHLAEDDCTDDHGATS